ncbi:MAG: thermostable hemolysin [Kordiimonadaceae bacterium]|nr:thermostable hemolysin [Kordiimonadaceae bacterium]
MLELAIKTDNMMRGNLYLNDAAMGRFTTLNPSVISITERFKSGRMKVERFIERKFEETYGASLPSHYPTMMSAHNAEGDIMAAVGFRTADTGMLFLEQYLPTRIEKTLSAATNKKVHRNEIIEIGSLASAGGGASIFLFIALSAYLKARGLTFAAVTATRELRFAFRFLQLEAMDFGPADKTQLPDGGAKWGTYYDTEPRVLAGDLSAAYGRLEHYLPEQQNQNLGQLFPRLHYGSQGEVS